MQIHDIFAANLKLHCGRFSSISEVARRAGINRQQFNRYLAGQNIPNKHTITRLAKFLGVEEAELFKSRESVQPIHSDPASEVRSLLRDELTSGGYNQRIIQTGYYCCFFPLQGTTQFVVKSVMKFTKKNGLCFFARHTHFRSAVAPKATLARGKHRGVVLANDSDIYLVGVNGLTPPHLSMIVIERPQIAGSPVIQGLSITRGTTSHFASRVCLEYLGSSFASAKKHMGGLGIIPMNSSDIDPTIALLMSDEPAAGRKSAQLGMPDFEGLMLAQRQDIKPELSAIA